MLSLYDYIVIAVYLLFLLGVGWMFRRAGHDSSEFFRGGGLMPWWLVGASSFMAAFSAWTFTGAAGLAYEYGLVVVMLYLAGVAGFLVNWAWSAAPFRQLRVIVVMEAVRQRLGRGNEQFFTWLWVPMQTIGAGIWLYGLAIFCAPLFGLDLRLMVIVCGLVVVFVAAVGGSWAVASNDFLQALMLFPITIVAALMALSLVGGFDGLIERLPESHLTLTGSPAAGFGIFWVIAVVVERLTGINNLQMAPRYLSVYNGKEARRAALLSAGLFLVGTFVWFIPPLASRALGMDLGAMFPTLVVPAESAYVAMAQRSLPAGLFGLMVTGMVAATLSSMDTALNRNAGILIRSVYLPLVRPTASERELVLAGRISTVVFGGIVILIALFYTTMENAGVFQIMFTFMAMAGTPCVMPMLLCLLIRKAPDWAGWSTVLVGLAVSALTGFVPTLETVQAAAQQAGFGALIETINLHSYAVIMLSNVTICTLWYVLAGTVFRLQPDAKRKQEIDAFFEQMYRPLDESEEGSRAEMARQSYRIGRAALVYAGFITLLTLVPNPWVGRAMIAFCALFIALVSLILMKTSRAGKKASSPTVSSLSEAPQRQE
ncbi:MAG: transporter [Verrucomicrobiota bacterium JB024]|nr:transporter [Verrucomicrobiota bacterium JB024]